MKKEVFSPLLEKNDLVRASVSDAKNKQGIVTLFHSKQTTPYVKNRTIATLGDILETIKGEK